MPSAVMMHSHLCLCCMFPCHSLNVGTGFHAHFFSVPYCGAVEPENRVTRSYTHGVELAI